MSTSTFTQKGFETFVPGKWILAGEHAVLRGCEALVFPLMSRGIHFQYQPSQGELNLRVEGEQSAELQALVWGVLERALNMKKITRSMLTGQISLRNDLPIGAGLGASAALCVAMTKWLIHLQFVTEPELVEFARQLENLFHGESSGVDIAVAAKSKPLSFLRFGNSNPFETSWQPFLYLSYSGQRGITLQCVEQVKEMHRRSPAQAMSVDELMRAAVAKCSASLKLQSEHSLDDLASAITLAGSCFEQWGLIPPSAKDEMQRLKSAGALAVKPTGSGNGGYVLSLWTTQPPQEIRDSLIPCFNN